MSEWQDIETAPANKPVLCGRWVPGWDGGMRWERFTAIAWHSSFFGLFRSKAYGAIVFTHWQPLPSPPTT